MSPAIVTIFFQNLLFSILSEQVRKFASPAVLFSRQLKQPRFRQI